MKIIKELIPYVVIILVVVVIRTFLITPVIVSGSSMRPTLENNEILLLNKFDKSYERFDIVVIDFDNGTYKEKLIKRIIGLPGEQIEYNDGRLYVNGKVLEDKFSTNTHDFTTQKIGSIKIPKDSYLVLGDNRNNSIDSRMIGFISKDDIEGITNIKLFPINEFGKIK